MHSWRFEKTVFEMSLRWLSVLLLCLSVGNVYAADDDEEGMFAPKVEYVEIKPEIVTNYGSSGRLHFLRARLSARATGTEAADAVRYHMAYIQNTLLLLLGGQTVEEAKSMEFRETLRQKALESINAFLETEGEPKIDDLLFTEYLVQ